MLDWAHTLTLRAVDAGDTDDVPALGNLLAAGLVERDGDAYRVTPAGRAALDASQPSRTELWLLRIAAGALAIFAVLVVIGWLT